MISEPVTSATAIKSRDKSATDIPVDDLYNKYDNEEPLPGFRHRGRYCWGGMPLWVFILMVLFIILCIVIAIMVPVLFITVGGALGQSAVQNTIITIDNQSIVYWGQNYQESCSASGVCPVNVTETDNSPTCTGTAQLVPNMLIMNQTLTMRNVPMEGVMQAGQYELWYTLENEGDNATYPTNSSAAVLIGDLMVPQLSLTGLQDHSVTLKDVQMTLMIKNPTFFTSLSAIKIAPGGNGLWLQQKGNAVLEADILGTKMYYPASMATWMFATNLLQCDGPMSVIPTMTQGCPCKNTCISWSH